MRDIPVTGYKKQDHEEQCYEEQRDEPGKVKISFSDKYDCFPEII